MGSLLAIIFGHVASRQIDRRGEDGRGFAVAGLVLGYIGLVVSLLIVVAAINASSTSDLINTDPANGWCDESRFLQDPDCG